MLFRLKNAGATYQRLMDRVLVPMIGQNVQAYVDDMVVTLQERDQHVADLEELFATIAKYRLKLNPEKCGFGVEVGKFLGHRQNQNLENQLSLKIHYMDIIGQLLWFLVSISESF